MTNVEYLNVSSEKVLFDYLMSRAPVTVSMLKQCCMPLRSFTPLAPKPLLTIDFIRCNKINSATLN